MITLYNQSNPALPDTTIQAEGGTPYQNTRQVQQQQTTQIAAIAATMNNLMQQQSQYQLQSQMALPAPVNTTQTAQISQQSAAPSVQQVPAVTNQLQPPFNPNLPLNQ